MEILNIRVMNGPNYWSVRRHKLIVMKLDLQNLEEYPTNKIPGFRDRLQQLLPGLYEHHCSEGSKGGFLYRVEKGTWMGHVIEHMALEIQTLAGMDVGFGRTREASQKGVYNVVFAYLEAEAGIYTAKAAVRIAQALIEGKQYQLAEDIQALREIREEYRLGPSTGSLVDEAVMRGIPYIRLNKRSLVQLGFGVNQKRVQATVASTTSSIGVEIAGDKEETKNLLEKAEIPVPKGMICCDVYELRDAIKKIGYPVVTKPINSNHGKGATTNIRNWDDAQNGLLAAKKYSDSVIVEKFISGHDHRVLVIDYKYVAAARRTPASVTGDGNATIQQLIDEVNCDSRRGYGHEKVLTAIKVDDFTMSILKEGRLTLDTVPPFGQEILLKPTANISTGGTATDITDLVHPDNIFMCERIARIIGLDICGIDIMTPDLSEPINDIGGAVLEVNAAPGFRMHLAPTDGLPRNVAEPVINMLFPPGTSSRIPIIAITGTNGKTTTTRLIAHILKQVGYRVGFTTTDGIYIQNQLMMQGDCTGPVSAQFILKDPTVEFAVLETARGGILRAGLGFDHCDIGIVTNVQPDHLGLMGIDTIKQLARVKGVIPESVTADGYAILNADDELVYKMRSDVKCNVALFSMDEKNPYIMEHCSLGKLAAVAENGYVTIMKGNWKIRVDKIATIPLTFGGKAVFNVQNILPAVLSCFMRGIKIEDIRSALETFIPSPATTPGRMNLFQFKNFQVLVDYAHNTAGLEQLSKFVEKIDGKPKVGVIAGVGDRRDEDILELGSVAARTFDEIVIRQDKNLRGRTPEEIIELMMKGIAAVNEHKKVNVIPSETEAIEHVIRNGKRGSFITICSDVVPDVLGMIMKYKEEEDNFDLARESMIDHN
ncbi:MAG: cyanophycin synthetase [Chitinophagales bacterium]|nr:cyanophycin synthetase [Chitinophagales bacterium]